MAIQCDQPPPASKQEVTAALKHRDFDVGTAFRANVTAESVVPRFLSKRKAKRMGQYRAVDSRTTIETKFYAELVTREPEKWRLDFETFERSTQTAGAEEAKSTHELPDHAFFVSYEPEGVLVTDEHGEAVTDSQARYTTAIAEVLRERHAWGAFMATREFSQGKVVEAPKDLVLGKFVESMLGTISDGHSTVSFFRFAEDGAKKEVAHFDVHSRYKATEAEMKDGSYFDLEAKGRAVLRLFDGMLMGYDLTAKVTPRAATGAMLPEGSGTWRVSFEIDELTLQVP